MLLRAALLHVSPRSPIVALPRLGLPREDGAANNRGFHQGHRSMPTFAPRSLRALTHLIASRMGSDPEEADEVADHLVRANLAGHDSHGVGMLPAYVRLLQDGLLVPNQTPDTVLDAGALLVVDARRGYGQRVTADAVRRAIARAKELGACVLALRNASHVGRIGTYGELAAQSGCAFTALVNH
jgi:uncharacterized oxidoreductase